MVMRAVALSAGAAATALVALSTLGLSGRALGSNLGLLECPSGALRLGSVCCPGPPTCAACGGHACHAEPGGFDNCCVTGISATCSPGTPPPCRLSDALDGVEGGGRTREGRGGAAAAASPEPIPDWTPSCNFYSGGHMSQNADGTFTITPQVYGMSDRWGNALSPYWQMRGMAFLGGTAFNNPSPMAAWMAYLPRELPAPPPGTPRGLGPDRWAAACADCSRDPNWWMYSHNCVGAWDAIHAAAVADTRAALAAFAAATGAALPAFEPGDVVIQNRCAADTNMAHDEYGPIAFSFYDTIPPDTRRIFLVSDRKYAERLSICRRKNETLHARLVARHPRAAVVHTDGDAFYDFAQLVFAPTLYKEQSSFGLWAALANNGTVWSAPLYQHEPFHTIPGWRWTAAPVLYPKVGAALGFPPSRDGVNDKEEAIIKWLNEH